MIAASYVWRNGNYYDYGWFVPPAALWLVIWRWRQFGDPLYLPQRRSVLALAALLLPWILILRVLGNVDPSWRLPIGLLGVTATLSSHALIAVTYGWRVSAGFVWITLLCLSAMPWPSAVESWIVHHLTQGVVMATAEVFHLYGKPVEVLGDRLRLHDLMVEVTDGCSGVRSFQSFVMATWFFAELQRLRVAQAMLLLTCACGAAFVVNLARSFALALIRFEHGELAFEHAHDGLGLLAFMVSGLFFYYVSGKLSASHRGKVLRMTSMKDGHIQGETTSQGRRGNDQ